MAVDNGSWEEPPKLLKMGLGYQIFNAIFGWLFEHTLLAGDNSITIVPGVGGKPGRIYSSGGTGGVMTLVRTPWQPYASVWRGNGPDPHEADRKMRIRLTPGQVFGGASFASISNVTEEFVCFGSPTDNEIKHDDAVVTWIYVKIFTEENPAKSLRLDDGQIMLSEGTLSQTFAETLPETPPVFLADGSYPSYAIYMLRKILYYGGALHLDPTDPDIGSGVSSNLTLSVIVSDVGCETQGKGWQWTRT